MTEDPRPAPVASEANGTRRGLLLSLASAAVCFAALATFLFRAEAIYDGDSYYHLAIGRVYATAGIVDQLPWARFSLLADGFGDKELLFHLLLAPFTGGASPTAGGRLVLALLGASIFGGLAWLGWRAAGVTGLLVPWFVFLGSQDVLSRLIRLRPELLSLLLFLLAFACAARRRHRTLGVVALIFALSYTAFHALILLAVAWFLAEGWTRRRWEWGLVLYPLVGVGLGILVHPHFPHNLLVWKVQSLDFFFVGQTLDVGVEIQPETTRALLLRNLPWLMFLAIAWASSRSSDPPTHRPSEETTRAADFALVTAGCFGLLYLLMQRFSIYAVPFTILAFFWELRRRGLRVGRVTYLLGRGPVPTLLLLGIALGAGVWQNGRLLAELSTIRTGPTLEEEWTAFGRAVPARARVTSTWDDTHVFMFFAPQAFYNNVLDPIFMAIPYPEAYAAQRRIFADREPDVPGTLVVDLDSDHLAFSSLQPTSLPRRLAGDPRVTITHRGLAMLYRLEAGRNEAFQRQWRVVPPDQALPVPAGSEIEAWPRLEEPADLLRPYAALVEVRGPSSPALSKCTALATRLPATREPLHTWELTPWGPVTLWADGEPVVAVRGSSHAALGQGLLVELASAALVTVQVCPDHGGGRAAFYLLDRDREPLRGGARH